MDLNVQLFFFYFFFQDQLQFYAGADPEFLKKREGANLAKCGILYCYHNILHDHTSKNGKKESTPLYSIF